MKPKSLAILILSAVVVASILVLSILSSTQTEKEKPPLPPVFEGIGPLTREKLCEETEYYDYKRHLTSEIMYQTGAISSKNRTARWMWKLFYKLKYRYVMVSAGLGYVLIVSLPWILILIENFYPWILGISK